MIRKYKGIYLATLLSMGCLGVFSCAKKTLKSEVWSSTNNSKISLFDATQTNSYRIIALETNEHSLIGGYDRVLANDQYLYIFDKENKSEVCIFTEEGKFVRRISDKGRGPSEYAFIDDVTLSDNYLILLDSRSRKTLYFSLTGEFIKEVQQKDYRGMTFTSINDNQFAYYMHSNGFTPDNEEFLIVNSNGEISEGLIPRKGLTELQGRFGLNPYFANIETGLYFIPVFEDKIYRWSNGKLNAVYDFEIGDKQMNFQDVTEEPVVTAEKFSYIGSFFMTDYKVFVSQIFRNNKVMNLCGDIKDNTLSTWSGNFTIKGTYKQFFITNFDVEFAKEFGIKVEGKVGDNDVVVLIDGNVFIDRVKQSIEK